MALELSREFKLTIVSIPWNRRMRPTLVRWCERTEAVRPPPTRLTKQPFQGPRTKGRLFTRFYHFS